MAEGCNGHTANTGTCAASGGQSGSLPDRLCLGRSTRRGSVGGSGVGCRSARSRRPGFCVAACGPGSGFGNMRGVAMSCGAMGFSQTRFRSPVAVKRARSVQSRSAGGACPGSNQGQSKCTNARQSHPAKVLSTMDYVPCALPEAAHFFPVGHAPGRLQLLLRIQLTVFSKLRPQHVISVTVRISRQSLYQPTETTNVALQSCGQTSDF
jgi:hypothetical protein